MRIDWRLLARAATELDETLRGVRITGTREVLGGIAITLRARGGSAALHLAVFAQPPIVWLSGEVTAPQPVGATRAIGSAVASHTIAAVRCIPNERILAFDLQRRSSFGVVDASQLIVELIPRFGNVILCKDGIVVAALREFSLAQNSARAIEIGRLYVGPPPALQRPDAPVDTSPTESVLADFAQFAITRESERAAQTFAALQTRLLKRVEAQAHKLLSERASIAARLRDVERCESKARQYSRRSTNSPMTNAS
ncbi:MAG: NFACT family protein [Vulcanimicrobiaceae bacterium]